MASQPLPAGHDGAGAVPKLKVLDLFSGIGGFSLGLERTGGFETVAFCEESAERRADLARLWPDVPRYNDVRELTGAQLAADGIAIDVICGGFPCQDLSACGTGLGLHGERSGLWREFERIICEIRPQFVIVENSPELLDRWLGDILGALAAFGYDAEWECIPASAVGAPHRRDRLWIVAYPASFGQSRPRGLDFTVHPTPLAFGEAATLVASVQGNPVPFVCRRHDGVPVRMARDWLHALGNAVVPQIPELIGNAILTSLRTPAAGNQLSQPPAVSARPDLGHNPSRNDAEGLGSSHVPHGRRNSPAREHDHA